jgi:hypothetical protein
VGLLVKLVLVGAVVGVLVAVADQAVEALAEREAAERVSAQLGAPAVVDLDGWPISLRLLQGVVPRVTVAAAAVPLADTGARLADLSATLVDVELGVDDLVEPPPGLPPAAGGTFTAVLDAQAVQRLVGLPQGLTLAQIQLVEGAVRLQLGGLASVDATVAVEGDAIVLRPTAPLLDLAQLTLELPPLPAGAQVRAVEAVPNALRLMGSLDP